MEKIARFLFSMRMMAIAMVIFFIAIMYATFVESAYGTQAAKIMVYNAKWFEILLVLLTLNLISNIFTYRMFAREKIAILMFHLAFIVMIIGAGVTRYISFEGMMIVKEGETRNFIYSSEPYVQVVVNDGVKQYTYNEQQYMSEVTSNYFSHSFNFPEHKGEINIEYVNFRENLVDSLVINDSIKGSAFEIITGGMKPHYLTEGDFLMVGDVSMSYNKENSMPGIEVYKEGRRTMIKSAFPMRAVSMSKLQRPGQEVADSMYVEIPADTLVPFSTATLYNLPNGQQFVFKGLVDHAKNYMIKSPLKNAGRDCVTIRITDGNESRLVDLYGGEDIIPEAEMMQMNGLTYVMKYGSIEVDIPFSIMCRDFQLDRYPGSNSPSSFASEVTIIDEANNYRKDKRIFMNNVIDYQGYRFFQSGYEPDESGTHLSVNHDWWGTNISYLGYLMMGLGMLFSLIMPGTRFRELNNMIKKTKERQASMLGSIMIALFLAPGVFAQEHQHDHGQVTEQKAEVERPKIKPVFRVMSKEHSDELATLLVQDTKGRIIPFHTMCDQVLRKLYRSNTYEDMNAVQVVMSMHMHPDYWMDQPVIYVSSRGGWREKLKLKGKYVSMNKLIDANGDFIFLEEYKKAFQMKESKRGEYEKQLIKLAERYEVAQGVFSWRYMKMIPLASDQTNTWYSPLNFKLVEIDTSGIKKGVRYLAALDSASADLKPWTEAEAALNVLKDFQYSEAKDIVPDKSKVNMEVRYNKMNIFKNSYRSYLLIGFIGLVVFFLMIFAKPTDTLYKRKKIFSIVLTSVIGVIFLYHGYGLYLRWMVSGHAPWSNGYEAVVFIAWATVLTGLVFSRKNFVLLPAAAILASLMIFVTELNLLDPEITPLQPVLKSYWLMIHVAIITASYGPLGLSCILGIMNMFLFIFRNKKNHKIINLQINEITYISEMTMTVGVFMLTIGTFLGGIWANESWGRYWGWDPKETWALASVLVYAMILHFRYIPALKGKFLFNAVSMWGYASILFTFFGVNFVLTGLHSYAQGDSIAKLPNSVYIGTAIFVAINLIAYLRYRSFKKQLN